jgi:hypothetical protein
MVLSYYIRFRSNFLARAPNYPVCTSCRVLQDNQREIFFCPQGTVSNFEITFLHLLQDYTVHPSETVLLYTNLRGTVFQRGKPSSWPC